MRPHPAIGLRSRRGSAAEAAALDNLFRAGAQLHPWPSSGVGITLFLSFIRWRRRPWFMEFRRGWSLPDGEERWPRVRPA